MYKIIIIYTTCEAFICTKPNKESEIEIETNEREKKLTRQRHETNHIFGSFTQKIRLQMHNVQLVPVYLFCFVVSGH